MTLDVSSYMTSRIKYDQVMLFKVDITQSQTLVDTHKHTCTFRCENTHTHTHKHTVYELLFLLVLTELCIKLFPSPDNATKHFSVQSRTLKYQIVNNHLSNGNHKCAFCTDVKFHIKRTVARSHCNARRASRARRTWQVNTPRVRRAFVENFSDAPRAQDNLSKLLTTLSAIAALSAGTLMCTNYEGCRR